MIRIVYAPNGSWDRSISLEGCPILIVRGHVEPIASLWFRHLWASPSPDTVRAYAFHLAAWWRFLDRSNIEWWNAIADDVRYFQADLHQAGLKNSSINAALAAVVAFYGWCHSYGHLAYRIEPTRSHLPTTADTKVTNRRPVPKRHPRVNTKQEFDAILAANKRQSQSLQFRDELIGEFGRYVGLRRQEIAGLRVSDFNGLKETTLGASLVLRGEITKGGVERSVVVPSLLLRRTKRYVVLYRAEIIKAAASRRSYKAPDNLFLTERGTAITRQYITAMWASAASEAGIYSRFHMNRHAMATAVVAASKRNGLHPLLIAKELLGHAHLSTTMLYDHSNTLAEAEGNFNAVVGEAWDALS